MSVSSVHVGYHYESAHLQPSPIAATHYYRTVPCKGLAPQDFHKVQQQLHVT